MKSEKSELFLSVINANKGIIYKVANLYCKNTDYRSDLVQEIIIQLWKSFGNYNQQYELSTWMYRIALNVAISFYRKDKKDLSTPITESIIALAHEEEPGEMEENVRLLYLFINELGELDKALMLLYLDNKSHKEMAEILGITETNVATKISRIKERLRKKFSLANK
jgi:RNA polymerase sigma-70 factor (ECF subfamily)